MLLDHQDAVRFFMLHHALMIFVNQRLKVIPDKAASPEAYGSVPPALRLKVRNAWLANLDLTETFAAENPFHLSEGELAIVRSWVQPVAGKFYVFREMKKYTVFLTAEEFPSAYGVVAIMQPFDEMMSPYLPILIDTVLLPFQGKIVYDGLMVTYSIVVGPGIRRSLNDSYNEARKRRGVITSLPHSPPTSDPLATSAPRPTSDPLPDDPASPKPAARSKPPRNSKPQPTTSPQDKSEASLVPIIGLIDQFCHDHLNEEYAAACRRLAEKLARKRPSPLLSGKPNSWACGIVRTIGWVNFLDDRAQTPHMNLTAIDKAFGVSEGTGQGKSKSIRKMFRMSPLDPAWTIPGMVGQTPQNWRYYEHSFRQKGEILRRAFQELALRGGSMSDILNQRHPAEPRPQAEEQDVDA